MTDYDIFYDYCKNNNVEKAQEMINNGIDDFRSGFIGFCKAGNLELVKQMISLANSEVDINYGLRVACLHGKEDIVLYLLEKEGANDVDGGLFHAFKGKHIKICELLMQKYGAKIKNKIYFKILVNDDQNFINILNKVA